MLGGYFLPSAESDVEAKGIDVCRSEKCNGQSGALYERSNRVSFFLADEQYNYNVNNIFRANVPTG